MDRREFLQTMTVSAAAATLAANLGEPAAADEKPIIKKEEISMKKIIIAADPFAVTLKDAIVADLKEKGYEIVDVGAVPGNDIPYWDGAVAASKLLQADPAARAILFCGTGMGMSLIANRFKGVRASVVESVFAARMCRSINDSNALCLGSMIWGDWMAKEAVQAFLNTQFTEGLEGLSDFLHHAAKTVEEITG